MASLYLNESLDVIAFEVGRRVAMHGPDARHAAQVARVRTGERIGIGDGRGRIGWGPVVQVAADAVAIDIEEVVVESPRRPELWLVQALAKGDRDELAVQAATELGVTGVVPWQAARSVSRWAGPKAAKGVERWRTICREAAKQAIRPSVPTVGDLASTADLATRAGQAGVLTLVLEPSAATSLRDIVTATAVDPERSPARIELVVGPEGGIDPFELHTLEAVGARLTRLGPEILRTSTAGPAALAALATLLGSW
ncbi:MAG TPA: 16S rRNA (uracil(1498)-N(3))-methyltransferase [Microbacteriaceae bacterium]|nr:16S rRNA (uracil(1498)-N(3))-methyltransferase [Microbacteriaceae bacterium]